MTGDVLIPEGLPKLLVSEESSLGWISLSFLVSSTEGSGLRAPPTGGTDRSPMSFPGPQESQSLEVRLLTHQQALLP